MESKAVSRIMLIPFLIGMLTLTFNIQPVKAEGTIYIRADGSVEPSTAPIQRDGDVFTFTEDIYDKIVVERSNIIINGVEHTLQGSGSGKGFYLSSVNNVTIQSTNIKGFSYGIQLESSNYINISRNNITNYHGIYLWGSSNNTISRNNIINDGDGIVLESSSNNIVSGNDIINNHKGIALWDYAENSKIYGNNLISNTHSGLYVVGVSLGHTVVYHNNFVNNNKHVFLYRGSLIWDDGYPSGGNYWSDYAGVDLHCGPDQNLTEGIGRDGIGDTPYVIDSNNLDHYPLMIPWTSETLLHPLEGQYANYTIRVIDSSDETVIDESPWNLTYHRYVSPFLIYVMSWMDHSYPEWDWTALNITNRYAYHFIWPITGRIGDMWFPGWIETNITTSSTIRLLDGTATVVGDKKVKVNSRILNCWELLHIEDSTIEHTFWYHKTTGLLIGQEAIVGSVKVNTTLVDTNILRLTPRTWTVDDDGPADFSSIQEAINSPRVMDGDAVYVYNGTYYENVVVNKAVSLIGENRETTIIDGSRTGGTVVNVTAGKVTFSGFTIQYSGLWYYDSGILLFHSNGSRITENIITNNWNGIGLEASYDNSITDNVITNNYYFGVYLANSGHNNLSGNIVSSNAHGVSIMRSGSNVLRKNHMLDNYYNFGVFGIHLSDFIQDIDTSNNVEGKPIYYLINTHDEQIPADAGYVAVVNSTNITVRNLTLTNNDNGVLFANTNSSIIENVTVTSNYGGIELWKSNGNTVCNSIASNNQWGILMEMSNNTSVNRNLISRNNQMGIGLGSGSASNIICENTISDNFGAGISIWESEENTIYHNNFLNDHAYVTPGYTNTWDDGYPSGGNYWSDYEEKYPDAQELDGSGIWNTPYEIDENNKDNYPLMKPWTPLPKTISELKTKVEELGSKDQIDNQGIVKSLITKLNTVQKLVDKGKIDEAKIILADDFIPQVQNLSGIHITPEAADILIKTAEYIISHI